MRASVPVSCFSNAAGYGLAQVGASSGRGPVYILDHLTNLLPLPGHSCCLSGTRRMAIKEKVKEVRACVVLALQQEGRWFDSHCSWWSVCMKFARLSSCVWGFMKRPLLVAESWELEMTERMQMPPCGSSPCAILFCPNWSGELKLFSGWCCIPSTGVTFTSWTSRTHTHTQSQPR